MTRDAQSALRRVMENYAKVTRFCVICNYVSKIIEPITSRCAKFRYKPLARVAMLKRLEYICDSESVKATPEALDLLITISGGDMRRSITLLQTSHALVANPPGDGVVDSMIDNTNILTEDIVHEIAGSVPISVSKSLIDASNSGKYINIEQAAKRIILQGYSADVVLQQLLQAIITIDTLSDIGKSQVAIRIADAETKLLEGADEFLQIMDVLSILMAAFNTHAM